MTKKDYSQPKIILGIETSCDETAAAVVQKTEYGTQILSNIVASSAELQAKYGGVIPEQAARQQLSSIIPVLQEALRLASLAQGKPINETLADIDALAVTEGPGLIGCLLVGVEAAKTLSLVWDKPLVPVHHLLGHFYANWIINQSSDSLKTDNSIPSFPIIGLLVSGGHTDLILMEDHGKYKYLGGTRDDAAGEAFDKTARLLALPYPGGPVIAKMAETGDPKAFKLPRPMIDSGDFNFSFSGLKTSISNVVDRISKEQNCQRLRINDKQKTDLAASIQEAIVDVLVEKTIRAAQQYNVDQIMIAGGVAANKRLGEKFGQKLSEISSRARIFIPPPKLCTDNAAYIATAAFYNYQPTNPLGIQANPTLSLGNKL